MFAGLMRCTYVGPRDLDHCIHTDCNLEVTVPVYNAAYFWAAGRVVRSHSQHFSSIGLHVLANIIGCLQGDASCELLEILTSKRPKRLGVAMQRSSHLSFQDHQQLFMVAKVLATSRLPALACTAALELLGLPILSQSMPHKCRPCTALSVHCT